MFSTIPISSSDPNYDLLYCSPNVTTIQFEAKENIYSKLTDLESFNFFIVRKGAVKLFTQMKGQYILDILYPGLFFANHANASIHIEPIATEDTEVSFLNNEFLSRLIQNDSKFVRNLILMLSNQVLNFKLMVLSSNKVQLHERLAAALIIDFENRGFLLDGRLAVKKILSHEEWALYFHARRESISRAFQLLVQAGAISKNPNFLFLENKKALVNSKDL